VKRLLAFSLLFIFSSFAFAQQQNFMSIPDEWEIALIQWDRTGSTAAGKYLRNWIDADYDVNRTEANVFATIKGSSVVLNIGGTIYNSTLVKTGLSIVVKNGDGTISNRVFESASISTYNKNIQALNAKAAKYKARAAAIAKAEEQANLLDGEISTLVTTSQETIAELTAFQTALQNFLTSPNSNYRDQQSGATAMKGLLDPLNLAERAFDDLKFDVNRKDCNYLPDIERRQKILETTLADVQTAPNSAAAHQKPMEALYKRASERLALAATQITRQANLITRENINFKPTTPLVNVQSIQKTLETKIQAFRTFLNSFDKSAKNAVTDKITVYRNDAAKLIAGMNCPAK
jgi:hypothetical protein